MTPDQAEAADTAARQRRYWRRTQWLTGALLAVWLAITFLPAYFARELNRVDFLGFPLGFYLNAQGDLLGYLLIIAVYAKRMNRLDELAAGAGASGRND